MKSIEVYNKIKRLQKDHHLSNRALCRQAGVSHSVLDNWKKRDVIPSVPVLDALCFALGISVSQLLAYDDLEDLTADEQMLLEIWSTLKIEDKKILLDLMRNMRSKY